MSQFHVKAWQKILAEQGLYTAVVDGDFGPASLKASQELLKKLGPIGNADGVAVFEKNEPLEINRNPIDTNVPVFILPRKWRKTNELIWHCAATREGQSLGNPVATIDRWHRERGWSGIGYHFVVDLDGKIYLGRDINSVGAHVANHNSGTIGAVYVGGLTADGKRAKDTRTPKQRAAMLMLTKLIASKWGITRISGHNQYAAKACPSFDVRSDELGNIAGFTRGERN